MVPSPEASDKEVTVSLYVTHFWWMIEETVKLFSSEMCMKPERSGVMVITVFTRRGCTVFTLNLGWGGSVLYIIHTVVRARQSSPWCICQGSVVLLSPILDVSPRFLSGDEGCGCRYGKQGRESCCSKWSLSSLCLVHCFFFMSQSRETVLFLLYSSTFHHFFSFWCNHLLHHGYNPGFDKQRITPFMGRAGSWTHWSCGFCNIVFHF